MHTITDTCIRPLRSTGSEKELIDKMKTEDEREKKHKCEPIKEALLSRDLDGAKKRQPKKDGAREGTGHFDKKSDKGMFNTLLNRSNWRV